ncbi:TPA: hypothetical protein DCW61_05275 [Candidatus Uhrbacteria bacterium]|nr:hypothetical protein [Candidatus Uhrbacteria bacterium]
MPNGSKVVGFERVFRVTVIVPSHSGIAERITGAILKHDSLRYGDRYDQVVFESGIGFEKYRSLEGANPTVGEIGRRSEVPSIELSFTLPRGGSKDATHLREVLDAIVEVHPWEEPQIFVQDVLATRTQKSA